MAIRGKPNLVIIGCPHLSTEQLKMWSNRIEGRVKVETWMVTGPTELERFKYTPEYDRLVNRGIKLMTLCSLAIMESPHLKRIHVLTNSGKLAYYTSACYGTDYECLAAMMGREALR